MTVLVTGATGLLGSHLTDHLLERGEHVRVLLQRGDGVGADGLRPFAHPNVEICWGHLGDRSALGAAMRGVDRVLHCAARTGPWGPQAAYEGVNVRGLQTLVESALAAGVQRFVHVSSITVHGNDVHGTADETAPLHTESNPYSRSKVAGERLLDRLIREQGAPITIVRPGWIYGPRDVASFARFAAMIQQGRSSGHNHIPRLHVGRVADRVRAGTGVIVGLGRNVLPFVYVTDIVQGLLLAAEHAQAIGQAYNISTDQPLTQEEFLSAIGQELGVASPRLHAPYHGLYAAACAAEQAVQLTRSRRPPMVTRLGVKLVGTDNRHALGKARCELGYTPRVNLREGVRRAAAWYKATHLLGAVGSGRSPISALPMSRPYRWTHPDRPSAASGDVASGQMRERDGERS